MLTVLRNAPWLTRARIARAAWLLLACEVLALAALVLSLDGVIDPKGRPLGTDFAQVWAAGQMVNAGHPAGPFDPAAHYAVQKQAFARPDFPFYGWHYPPTFLPVASLLARLPYVPALGLYQAATLAAFLAMIWLWLREGRPVGEGEARGDWLLLAAAAPAVFVNLTHGQNGFLTAALLGLGLVVLPRRPLLAGAAFALLTVKPQLGLLIPLALAAGGQWRAFAAAAVGAVALAGLSAAAYGLEPWRAFLEFSRFSREVVLESGMTGFEKMTTVFAALRLWGAPLSVAYAAQALAALAAAWTVWRVWRSPAAYALKAAVLATAALLATPYAMDYDLCALGVALAAFLAAAGRGGLRPYEGTALALAWMLPLLVRPLAGWLFIPVAPLALGLLLAVLARRALAPAPVPVFSPQPSA